MPRGRDECWQEVERARDEDTNKRHPRVTCKHCHTEWTSNEKARVIEHLQRCTQLPEPLWRTYQPHRLDPSLPSAQEIQQQQRARTRGIGSMSSTEQDLAVAACAQWIHSAGLNASVTEHPAFKEFMYCLRPAFKIPSRHQLTHAMVDAPLMLIAYIADPQERHRRPAILDSSEENQNRSLQAFMIKYCDENFSRAVGLLSTLFQLRTKQGHFGNEMMWMASNQMAPIQWWHDFWLESQPELAELCILALAITPTGDSIERNWSPHSFLHELQRHSLGQDIVNKLIRTFWNLRIKHGWVDSSIDAGHEHPEQDADYTPDMSGFPTLHG